MVSKKIKCGIVDFHAKTRINCITFFYQKTLKGRIETNQEKKI